MCVTCHSKWQSIRGTALEIHQPKEVEVCESGSNMDIKITSRVLLALFSVDHAAPSSTHSRVLEMSSVSVSVTILVMHKALQSNGSRSRDYWLRKVHL